MGAPGAALLYVVLAAAVLPKETRKADNKESQSPAYWLAFVWALFLDNWRCLSAITWSKFSL